MTDFLVLFRASESEPPRYVATVCDKAPSEATDAIEEALIGEGEYLAFPLDVAVVRKGRVNFALEVTP